MVTGLVFLNVERQKINSIADAVAGVDGISEVYSIGGAHDLVAIIRVKDNEKLAEIVTEHLLKVDGILKSETHLAFKVYSRHDLDKMFSIGMDY